MKHIGNLILVFLSSLSLLLCIISETTAQFVFGSAILLTSAAIFVIANNTKGE